MATATNIMLKLAILKKRFLYMNTINENEIILTEALVLFCTITVILLSIIVYRGNTLKYDKAILEWFNKHKSKKLTKFFKAITWFGSMKTLLPIMAIISIILFYKHYPIKIIILFNTGIFGVVTMSYSIKFLLYRTRPNSIVPKEKLPKDPSFPSAHTAQSFAFSLMIWLLLSYMGYAETKWYITTTLLFIATMVGLSRMYLQVHYPTDVLAGILLAVGCSLVIIIISKTGVLL